MNDRTHLELGIAFIVKHVTEQMPVLHKAFCDEVNAFIKEKEE